MERMDKRSRDLQRNQSAGVSSVDGSGRHDAANGRRVSRDSMTEIEKAFDEPIAREI